MRNKVQLIGHLGNDPEVKQLDSGKTLAKLSLATTDRYTNQKGEKVSDTQWHNLIAWGKTADIAERFLKKGNEVAIEGKLSSHSYEDKEGIKKYITEVIISEILLLGSKD